MTNTALLYLIASIASFAACVPQISKIIITKNTGGLSLKANQMWFIFQLGCLPYVFESDDWMWQGMAVTWALYYIVMIVLILLYDRSRTQTFREWCKRVILPRAKETVSDVTEPV